MVRRFGFVIVCCVFITACWHVSHQRYQGYVMGENIYIASPMAGELKVLAVMRGQRVKKGQLLFVLDDKPQSFLVSQALSSVVQAEKVLADLKAPRRLPEIDAIKEQIEQAKAQLDLAQFRAHRNQTLYDKRVLDKDSLDASIEKVKELGHLKAMYEANLALAQEGAREGQIEAQQALKDSAQAKYEEAQWELSQKKMRAPTSGIIFDTYYNPGEYVTAQRPVVALLAPELIYLEFFVSGDDLNRIRVGTQIEFIAFGSKTRRMARVSYIASEAEYAPPLIYTRENASKLVFRVKAKIVGNALKFKPGQPVEIII